MIQVDQYFSDGWFNHQLVFFLAVSLFSLERVNKHCFVCLCGMKELVEFSCIFSSFFNIVDPIFLNIASVED